MKLHSLLPIIVAGRLEVLEVTGVGPAPQIFVNNAFIGSGLNDGIVVDVSVGDRIMLKSESSEETWIDQIRLDNRFIVGSVALDAERSPTGYNYCNCQTYQISCEDTHSYGTIEFFYRKRDVFVSCADDDLANDQGEFVVPTPIVADNVHATIPTLNPIWELSAEILPTGTTSGWSNLLHATIGGNVDRVGDRVPGIWFNSDTTKLHICSAVSGNRNYCINSEPLPMNEWSALKVSQTMQSDGTFQYKIEINQDEIHSGINTWPQVFQDVKLYMSDPWYPAASASTKNVEFKTSPVEDKSVILSNLVERTVPILHPNFSISLEIFPTGTVSGWSSVFRATIGGNSERYGDRSPAIFFYSGSTKMAISGAVNGNVNYYYTSEPLALNEWSHVKITQKQVDVLFIYTIEINDVEVHQIVNKQPTIFEDLTAFKGDPWYAAAVARVRNVQISSSPVEDKSVILTNVVERTVPILHPTFSVSVDIFPTGTVTGWSSVFRGTIGGNNERYGDRVPAIFFYSGTTKMAICGPVNGNSNHCFTSEPLAMNKWSTVKVAQALVDEGYVFTITINGVEVHSVINTQTQDFENVTVYKGDPWYSAALAKVSNIIIQTE